MPTEIKLPRLGQGMDEGRILKWLKAEGDAVDKGEEIYEVETEKVNMEVEAPAGGTLLKIVVPDGETVPIGTVIAYVGEPGEAVPDAAPQGGGNGASSRPAATESAPPAPATPGPSRAAAAPTSTPSRRQEGSSVAEASDAAGNRANHVQLGGQVPVTEAPSPQGASPEHGGGAAAARNGAGADRVKASPLARRIAADRGIDLGSVRGTGPEGRIVARDLENVEAAAPAAEAAVAPAATGAPDGAERVELTSMRRTIARRLGEAWQAPAFYLTVDIDMEQANALRERLLSGVGEGEVRPTVSDVITKASAAALRRHPDMNVHFAGDAILRFSAVHVGMAVATDQGLVVPVIRDVHAKSVREIAADRKIVVDKARKGKLTPADMEGGTFTISNLGMMGIDEFTAVLNPPMAGILAVGQTKDRVVAVKGRPEVRPVMTVTLGCDHRAVDGAVGARFLQTLKANLEDPLTML